MKYRIRSAALAALVVVTFLIVLNNALKGWY
jgi:hypothetical protein